MFFRGEVLARAGTEEAIVCADIGKIHPGPVEVSGVPAAVPGRGQVL